MKSILIIGSNSFIGRSLIPVLLESEYEVHALARNHNKLLDHPRLIKHAGELGNNKLIRKLLTICNTTILLACATVPGSSARHPSLEARDNLLPGLEFIEALQSLPRHHVIFVSSGGTVYGDKKNIAALESDQPDPRSYYGASKAAMEIFLRTLHYNKGIDITILRPSNLYGPGQPLRQSFGLIRTLLDRALHNKSVEIWGDGTSVRDYLYINDFVAACMNIINTNHANHLSTYNLGSGRGYNINEIIGIIEKVTGLIIKRNYRSSRSSDIRNITLNIDAFKKEYQWLPTTGIETGIEQTWEWLNESDKEHFITRY